MNPALIPPSVLHTVTSPGGGWTVTNQNPSGDKEWEVFRVAASGGSNPNPDVVVGELPAGVYDWRIQGADGRNTLFIFASYVLRSPVDCIGTGTPGYWKNHPEAWPRDGITIGGIYYAKEDAIALMGWPDKSDKTYTMFRALVAAKLNVLIGNGSICIDEVIIAADDWMADYGPVGNGVRADSTAWKEGEILYEMLDKYNNGLLPYAPSRDALECNDDEDEDNSGKNVPRVKGRGPLKS